MKARNQAKAAANETFKPYKMRKGEKYMSPRQKKHFLKILQDWKSQLVSEVDRTIDHLQTEANRFPDDIDQASQEEDFDIELRARDREHKLIQKIDHAISLITIDKYGKCVLCETEIGIHRLEARPTAMLCIECKTAEELKEQHLRN